MIRIMAAVIGGLSNVFGRAFKSATPELSKLRGALYSGPSVRIRRPGEPGKAGDKLARMAREGRLTMKSGNQLRPMLHTKEG